VIRPSSMEAVVVVVVFVASIEDDDDVDTGNVDVVKVVGVPGGVNVSVVVKSIYVINDDNVVFRDVDCSDVRGGVGDPDVVFEDCDGCKVDGVLGVLVVDGMPDDRDVDDVLDVLED
jgi:hypothetical protein